jgi:hypothetical protein
MASDLEEALIRVTKATDAAGRPIVLCPQPHNVDNVRKAIARVAAMHWGSKVEHNLPGSEFRAAINLGLLADCLREHLKETADAPT